MRSIGEAARYLAAVLGGRPARVRRGRLCGLTVGLLAQAAAAQAQTALTTHVSVDATAPGPPLQRVWSFHGYDEINYTTSTEGEGLLRTLVAAHTAPVHVRSHFLFNTGDGTPAMKWGSTNVYTEDPGGSPSYDWTLTDGIMDTVTGVGAFPFVELGFMPRALSVHPDPYRNTSTIGLSGGCFYPPSDYGKWAALVSTWATHAAGRYPDVAGKWLWELWNEPDSGYWHGTFAEYAKLYDHTEAALHAVLPEARLGGPAVIQAGGDFLRQFLEHCATGTNAVTGATGTRLDHVTFHAKGGVTLAGEHVRMDLGTQLRLHRAGFEAVAAAAGALAQVPIYITEADPEGCAACPVSDSPENAYRNSPAYGAYEIAMMKHTLDLASALGVRLGGVLTWAFTFPGTPYFAGYRALATNGISLPVLSAFKLLGRLEGARLPLESSGARSLDDVLAQGVRGRSDIDGMATLDGDRIQVLVWNYHDDLESPSPAPVRLTVAVPPYFGTRVRTSHLRVDDSHGNAHVIWIGQGSPSDPTPAQRAALEQAMEPATLVPDAVLAVAAERSVGVDFDLPRFGVSLLTIESAPDAPSPEPRDAGAAPAIAGGGGCACGLGGRLGGRLGQAPAASALPVAVLLVRRRRARPAAAGNAATGVES